MKEQIKRIIARYQKKAEEYPSYPTDAIVTFKTEHYADRLRRMLEKDLPHTSFNVVGKKVFISGLEKEDEVRIEAFADHFSGRISWHFTQSLP